MEMFVKTDTGMKTGPIDLVMAGENVGQCTALEEQVVETRKLASVRRIDEIKVHDNADSLELAMIGGWQVVVKKGEFQPGDLCVYFEIDSYLPREERYHFLAKNSYRKTEWGGDDYGYKLRTIKLRGQLSQGMALPFTFFDEIIKNSRDCNYYWNSSDPNKHLVDYLYEGDDLTAELRIKKWDPPLPAQLRGKVKGYFPSFIQKTDQERFQNLKGIISQYHMGTEFEVTEKLDGSSMTVYVHGDKYGVCSRNLEIAEESEGNSFWEVVQRLNLIPAMQKIQKELGFDFAIQGELVGPGVQKNPYKLAEREFFVYDVYNISYGRYHAPSERMNFINWIDADGCRIQHVPILGYETPNHIGIDNLLQYAEGKSRLADDVEREGIVFKATNLTTYKGKDHIFSFKAISNRFLISQKD